MTSGDRVAVLLHRLVRRDEQGHPLPATLAELRELVTETEEPTDDARPARLQRRVERTLLIIRARNWHIVQQSTGGGRGRPRADQVQLWALLPGEPLIV